MKLTKSILNTRFILRNSTNGWISQPVKQSDLSLISTLTSKPKLKI